MSDDGFGRLNRAAGAGEHRGPGRASGCGRRRPARRVAPAAPGVRRASGISRATGLVEPLWEDGLREYQVLGARWLRSRARALLADEMGLGKTAQTLRALPARARALVVCPASVTLVWREEVLRWRPDLDVRLDFDLPREREVVIFSYDALPPVGGGPAADLRSVTLVGDEVHRVKNADALRTARFRALARRCARVWGLSGTPMTGTPLDLWGVLTSLGLEGEAFPGGADEFDALTGREAKRAGAGPRAARWGNVSREVRIRLERVMLRRLRRDHLDLPPVVYVDVPVPAPDDLREYLGELAEQWGDEDAGDLPPFQLYSAATAALARSRIDAAVDLARDKSREVPTIVFSAHEEPVRAVAEALGVGKVTGVDSLPERADAVAKFRRGETRCLPITIQAGGEGLNVPEARAIIFVDRDYTPAMNEQAAARARRPGNLGVVVYRMRSDHPLDVRLQEILDEKERLISQALEVRDDED